MHLMRNVATGPHSTIRESPVLGIWKRKSATTNLAGFTQTNTVRAKDPKLLWTQRASEAVHQYACKVMNRNRRTLETQSHHPMSSCIPHTTSIDWNMRHRDTVSTYKT